MSLKEVLLKYKGCFAPITPFDLNKEKLVFFDLSDTNKELAAIDLSNTAAFSNYIFSKLDQNHTPVGIGMYGEDRCIYRRSTHFGTEEPRSIHLGIDLWALAGTPVYAPLEGKIHSFKNNSAYGDYGPTIILEHQLDGVKFHTLYGHLSMESLDRKTVGQIIAKGEKIATLGDEEVNVQWPPHLHFQLIENMQGKEGDYPGVCKPSEKEIYFKNCPDPNLIVGIN